MASPTLTLQLSDKTLKKLRALAMLSGSTVDQLEKEFADYFDRMLSENIASILSELDGTEVILGGEPQESTALKPPTVYKEREEALEEAEGEDPNAHDLSEDDLPEEVKSTAETVEDEIQPPQYTAPNAGGNADAFLDAALAPEQTQSAAQQMVNIGGMTGNLRSAGKGFNPNKPRASVAEFTGDN